MQVLAILSLQHCHKELLLGLYWPLWTLLGLGSSIAMCGVVISQIYSLKGHEPPKYTIALGTPVLVVSACGDFVATEVEKFHRKIKRTYTEERSTLKKSFTSGSSVLPIAQANTLGEAGRDLEAGLGEEAQIGDEAQTQEGLHTVASPSKKP
ncbi:hypothetical protein L207DRAFT_8888 [Hyaloscypha variabilis F]|uniref:Uncharacterized protein n=1 Tax=Hyaloscypha variabilis (strain UAMH 11265 / GT02V1 / F) TaxID=1149755 RepID=A0A2J6SCN8_HYAVF|nr:hypothetical protein L207DRAFT_8888 [Hyaloscypha variabilis F]